MLPTKICFINYSVIHKENDLHRKYMLSALSVENASPSLFLPIEQIRWFHCIWHYSEFKTYQIIFFKFNFLNFSNSFSQILWCYIFFAEKTLNIFIMLIKYLSTPILYKILSWKLKEVYFRDKNAIFHGESIEDRKWASLLAKAQCHSKHHKRGLELWVLLLYQ